MTDDRDRFARLRRKRWRILIAFWLTQTLFIYTAFTVWDWFGGWGADPNFARLAQKWAGGLFVYRDQTLALAAAFLLTLLQVVFVWPVRRPRIDPGPGPSALFSLAAAGFFIALIAASAVMAVVEFLRPEREFFYGQEFPPANWILWFSLGLSWLIATPLLIAFCRKGPRDRVLSRLAAWIFVGTIIEIAAVIPLDVLVRRRDHCHCATGTYWALTLCGAVGLIVLGPAVLIPILARRRKRWYAGRCEVCGYDMRGLKHADCCPECGAGWKPDASPPRP